MKHVRRFVVVLAALILSACAATNIQRAQQLGALGKAYSDAVSAAGDERYYFSGHLEGEVASECRRCLTDVTMSVAEDVQLLFVEADTEGADDPDVYVVDPKAYELDLRPALREQWLLAVPAFAECRDDCKGLCPTCGADLNAGACECAPATDSRWETLRKVRGQSN